MKRREMLQGMMALSITPLAPVIYKIHPFKEPPPFTIEVPDNGWDFDFARAEWEKKDNGWWKGSCRAGNKTCSAYFKLPDGPQAFDGYLQYGQEIRIMQIETRP